MNGEAIQGALWRSVWGYRNPTVPDGKLYLTHAACYADLFGHYGFFKTRMKEGNDELISLFRLHKTAMTVSMANWFLHKYVLAILPARVRESVTIKRCFSKGYFALVEKSRRDNPPPFIPAGVEDNNCIPWLDIRVDTTKANMHDVFLLFTLVRTVQEYPRAIHIMFQLAEDHGMPLETAFFLASIDTGGGGHALLSTGSFYDSIPNLDDVLDWSLEKRWEEMKAYVEKMYDPAYKCIKEDNAKYFQISNWLIEGMRRGPDPAYNKADDDWDGPHPKRDESVWAQGFHMDGKTIKLIEGLLV